MQKIKVAQLIHLLPEKDKNEIESFIQINFETGIHKLFQAFVNLKSPTSESIWKFAYPKIPFNKSQFTLDCHQLLKGIEQAICHISLQHRNLAFYDVLLPYLVKNNLLDHFDFTRKKVTKFLDAECTHNHFSFYNHRLEYHKFKALESESSRKSALNITEASLALDEYYILLKLRYLCAALSHQKVKATAYEILFIESLIPQIQNSSMVESVLINCYLLTYQMLENKHEDENFQTLKAFIKEKIDLFSSTEINEIFIYPINFCIQRINSGQINYTSELLDLYKTLPSLNIESNETISPWRFKNIVDLALMSGEMDYAEHFIENFSHRLRDKYKHNAIAYNKAKLKFYQKDYDAVIDLLIDVEYQDAAYALICKLLLLKTYYEMKEHEALHSFLDSFRVYVLRSKDLTSKNRKQCLDLISIVKKLTKMEFANANEIELFKNKIKDKKSITDKAWVLEKINEL